MNVELRTDPAITTTNTNGVGSDQITNFHDLESDHDHTGDGVTVVVMDSGIDDSHPVFSDTEIEHVDVTGNGDGDEVGHGTACAGLIHEHAPDADLISLRIFGDRGSTSMSVIDNAYQWLFDNADRIDVVNMSWGATSRVPSLDQQHNKLISKGVRDVTAAGNSAARGGSPATAMKAYGIGALTINGDVTRFSSYNPERDNPDVSALGKDVRLARADGTSMGSTIDEDWTVASGTSFSAPITTAAIARLLSATDHVPTDTDLVKATEKTAADVPSTPEDGAGRLQYASTHAYLSSMESVTADVWKLRNQDADSIYIDEDILADGEYKVDVDQLRAAFTEK